MKDVLTLQSSEKKTKNLVGAESVNVLRLSDMIFAHKGSLMRRLVHAFISLALRLFFRRIETTGVEKVPREGAVIFVLNHPNGAVDPGLVFVSLPRRVSFLAKSTLFQIPVAGFVLRVLEALPVYRRVDAAADLNKNLETFENCHRLLARARCIAIFPEGISHDATKLKPIKTGAARIALGALAVGEKRDELARHGLKIMAVGLYYTSKTSFRSEALLRFGEIIEVEPVALDENGEPPREAVLGLTGKIEVALKNATLNTENTEDLESVTKAEALFSSIYKTLVFKQTLSQNFLQLKKVAERFDLIKRLNPEKFSDIRHKVEKYEDDLRSSGLTMEGLSVLQHPIRYVMTRLIWRALLIVLLSPLAVVGAIVHSPAFVFSSLIGLMFRTHGVDAAGSTFKILAACLFVPLTWLGTAGVVFYFFGWQFALASIPLTAACGYVALKVFEELIDMSAWLKASWLLVRERGLFLRLLIRRKTLRKEIESLLDDSAQI